MAERHLRPVGSEQVTEPGTEPSPARTGRPGRILAVLLVLLVLALLATLWSRERLSRELEIARDENALLLGKLARQQRLIEAHRARLEDVRGRVEDLRILLEEPLPLDE